MAYMVPAYMMYTGGGSCNSLIMYACATATIAPLLCGAVLYRVRHSVSTPGLAPGELWRLRGKRLRPCRFCTYNIYESPSLEAFMLLSLCATETVRMNRCLQACDAPHWCTNVAVHPVLLSWACATL